MRSSSDSRLPDKRRAEAVEGFDYRQEDADLVIGFIESVCCHTKDSPTTKAGEPMSLLDWHKHDVIEPLYGWKTKGDDTRRYRLAYLEVPKKNGKSTILSCLGIWHLILEGEGELGCIAAKDRNQAGIIFDETAAMVNRSPELRKMLEVVDSRKTIVCAMTGSSMRVISRDAGAAEGPSYSFVFCDELHAWPDRLLFEALRYSGRSRKSPLLCTITTAGHDRNSICWEQHEYAEQVIADPAYDPRFYGKIFGAKTDGSDDYFDPAVWARVNPGMGITMTEESFAADAREAKNRPSKLNGWLRYSLGVWTAQDTRWLPPELWAACKAPPPAPLEGRECWLGVDLAWSQDTTAVVAVFPDSDGSLDVLARFYLPSDLLADRERRDRVQYGRWAAEGHVVLTGGDVTDYEFIRRDIEEFTKKYRVRMVAVDPFNATHLTNQLDGAGIPVNRYRQGFAGMNAPCRLLENRLASKTIRHNSPVLDWQANNVAIRTNAEGLIRPLKPKPNSSQRVDGILALCMALGAWGEDGQKPAKREPQIHMI